MKLNLKKHEVLPSAYTTLDKKYLVFKDPETKRWCWGVFIAKEGKYLRQTSETRTLNDMKYVIQEQLDTTEKDQELWEG